METLADLWDALPAERRIFGAIDVPPAKAVVVQPPATLSSLPTEILHLIVAHCSNQDMVLLMQVNRIFHALALPILYADVHILTRRHEAVLRSISSKMPIDRILPFFHRKRFGVLGGLLQRTEHVATIRHLHIDDFPISIKAISAFHRILRYILDRATNLQSLYINKGITIPSKAPGLVVASSLKHIIPPTIQASLMTTLLDTARLHSPPNTSECLTFRQLQDLGEQLAASLCEISCTTFYIPQTEWNSFSDKYEDFVATILRMSTLQCKHCMCDIHSSKVRLSSFNSSGGATDLL
jgi:hypothetical protein